MKDNALKQFFLFLKNAVIHIKTKLFTWFKAYITHFKKARWYNKILIGIATFFCVFLLYLAMVDFNFLWLFGKSPSLSDVSKPAQNLASELYSGDEKLIGTYYRENRSPVEYEDISHYLIDALISTEDERFYKHFGIDVRGLFGALKDTFKGNARGGSTITQQLAKNLFKVRSQYSTGLLGYVPGLDIIVMKSKEWILAVKLEARYSKEEILTMYFNTVDFGSNAFGIKTAAKKYFGINPAKIKIEDAATLIGLLKATSTYNPRINPEKSIERRNIVLNNMYGNKSIKYLNKQILDSLTKLPTTLVYISEKDASGTAPYFREAVANELEDWCRENDYDLYGDGLKIYTQLDTRMQKYAEEAVNKQMQIVQRNFNNHWGNQNPWRDEHRVEIANFIEDIAKRTSSYKKLKQRFPDNQDSIDFYMNEVHKVKLFDYKDLSITDSLSTMDSIRYMVRFMHAGFVAIEPQTRYVKAWVGDINFDSWKYDKVTAQRQPGSTFKLFVYTAAMNAGMSPCDYRSDQYTEWDIINKKGEPEKWIPRNANGYYEGSMTLKAAFARSINTIAVQIAKEVGMDKVLETAKAMGITTPLENTASTALGSSDVTLLELVNSYCTVVNDGKYHDPVFVTHILDQDGKEIYRNNPTQKQVIPYESAFLMTTMLRGGMTEPGGITQALWGYDLFKHNTEFGGKTGTSSNHSDAWFVGITPKLVGGAWVGGEYRSIHFRSGALGEGSRTALPIFGYFMEKTLADDELSVYRARFEEPSVSIKRSYKCQTPYIPKDTTVVDSTDIEIIDL